jgi:alkylation response protein AidB-like acyl-CoA dehydrogenase
METEDGYDANTWKKMAQQLGLQGLAIPERYGGSGQGWVEQVIVLEEMGAALLCAPFLSAAVIAASALLDCDDDVVKEELLPAIAAGDLIATVAFPEDDADGQVTTASQTGAGWTLSGRKVRVIDSAAADLLLVTGRTSKGTSLFAISPHDPGVTLTKLTTMDQTRKMADIEFNKAAARLIGTEGSAAVGLARTRDLGTLALAAEQVGGAQRCLTMSVDYAKIRHQFGRPIGSFQAVKHLCADTLLGVETARSALYNAVWVAAEGAQDLSIAASIAKAYCSEVFFRAAADNIQLHGGIGYTWEHDAHLYFKRAKSSELYFGDAQHHRSRIADALGIAPLRSL